MAKRTIGNLYRALVEKSFRAQARARFASGKCRTAFLTWAISNVERPTSNVQRRTCGRWIPGTLEPWNPSVRQSAIGFTLIELLVVVAIITVLASILFPVFASARRAGYKAKCASNLRQLALANQMYAEDYDGRFVPAASDIFASGGGQWRWHGWRPSSDVPFQPEKGPLWQYLGCSGGIKECPAMDASDSYSPNAFEAGCGGYGYNDDYIGGSYWKYGWTDLRSCMEAARASDMRNPSRTVMFADAAIAQGHPLQHVTEYSFCEPPYILGADGQPTSYRYTPSIHFRHNGRTLVAWCDGHVTSEGMAFTAPSVYGGDNERFKIGWFGPDSNELFDLR